MHCRHIKTIRKVVVEAISRHQRVVVQQRKVQIIVATVTIRNSVNSFNSIWLSKVGLMNALKLETINSI